MYLLLFVGIVFLYFNKNIAKNIANKIAYRLLQLYTFFDIYIINNIRRMSEYLEANDYEVVIATNNYKEVVEEALLTAAINIKVLYARDYTHRFRTKIHWLKSEQNQNQYSNIIFVDDSVPKDDFFRGTNIKNLYPKGFKKDGNGLTKAMMNTIVTKSSEYAARGGSKKRSNKRSTKRTSRKNKRNNKRNNKRKNRKGKSIKRRKNNQKGGSCKGEFVVVPGISIPAASDSTLGAGLNVEQQMAYINKPSCPDPVPHARIA